MPASPPPTFRVAAVQMDPQIGQNEANLAEILGKLAEAAAGGAELVAFPECALSGYGFGSREEGWEFAEPVPGPATDRLVAACREHGVHAIVGMLERAGDRLYNAAVLLGPEGVVGVYRKVHLPFLGVDRFVDPGDAPPGVFEARGVRLGIHICYDASFPETGRVQALLGADVLVIVTNWPVQSASTAEHLPATRAIENVVYVMAVDRVGAERGFAFAGRSSIADPDGTIVARAGATDPAILYADVDPALARRKRLVRVPGEYELDRIADRRPEFYGKIVDAKIC
jgi:5-aminopentanamidase